MLSSVDSNGYTGYIKAVLSSVDSCEKNVTNSVLSSVDSYGYTGYIKAVLSSVDSNGYTGYIKAVLSSDSNENMVLMQCYLQ